MMKKIALLLALTVITAYTTNISMAATPAKKRTISAPSTVYTAISKYKHKNYTGVIQDLTPYLSEDGDKYKDKNNKLKEDSLAYYYYGLAYAQLGMRGEAQSAYNKAIELKTDQKLVDYAKRAVACLNGQPQCAADYVDKNAPALDDMTVFIQSGKFLHDDVRQQIQDKALDKQKDRINNDMLPDAQNYKLLNDASGVVNAQPTDAEIANAVKVLAKVGFNPYGLASMNAQINNPELVQLSALMGNTGSNASDMNYLPYIISQGSKNPEAAKQMIQNMMLNQMMPGFGGFNNL